MIFREVTLSDASKLAALIQQIDQSSEYMLWETGERVIETDSQFRMIENVQEKENSTILVVENNNNELVGYLLAFGGNARRNRHSAYIVIGISKNYRGQGLGEKLFKELDQWALSQNIHRLELTAVTKNEAGLALYTKTGFEIEGTKRNSLFIDGEFVDEYYMAKLF